MNEQQIISFLKERYIYDALKPEVDRFQRAAIIQSYLSEKQISGREFARQFNIPKSTVEDWLLYNKIAPEKFAQLQDKGLSASAIYREIRKSKRELRSISEFDIYLEEVRRRIRLFRRDTDLVASPKTEFLIDEVTSDLNGLWLHIKSLEKRRNA